MGCCLSHGKEKSMVTGGRRPYPGNLDLGSGDRIKSGYMDIGDVESTPYVVSNSPVARSEKFHYGTKEQSTIKCDKTLSKQEQARNTISVEKPKTSISGELDNMEMVLRKKTEPSNSSKHDIGADIGVLRRTIADLNVN
eukprot:gnl/Chilomastix_caulleri/3099.p1 GENE.gnl/Chilomastix_caulleri/3099~~gnl/Chilomastix_caulleri/3099.p1  ORF type:complete len:139 (-),score=10.65 gnl/Chilomastix_caulleri/3099:14-430(-)